MKMSLRKRFMLIGIGALFALLVFAITQLSTIGAAVILHPPHRPMLASPPAGCEEVTFNGAGVKLHGWRGQGIGNHRGTLIYLHGVADNRSSGAGIMDRFRKRGFNVVAYDSRANGKSEGDACTYGFHEKEDLREVLNSIEKGPVILLGSSLGAAVALQLAASDPRITAVVAAETFSDLRTVATERAPFFFNHDAIKQSFDLAEKKANFRVDVVSPKDAATKITIPVLLIHGEADTDTPPDHSRRIHAALAGPKRLIIIPGARHNESLHGEIWEEIERWIDTVLPPLSAE